MHLTHERLLRAQRVYDRTLAYYGESPHHDFWEPELACIHDPNFEVDRETGLASHGSYGDEIIVNFQRCRTWKAVVGTLIHEYWHHHQDPDRVDEDAYDAEANAIAARDLHLFMED